MDSENTQTEDTKLSFGGKAVGLSFNPSGDTPVGHNVNSLKQQIATFIDFCDNLRAGTTDPEVKRMLSVAITEAQTAQMWAVKAVTWSN
jgi:hypothetical protein